MYPKSFGMRCMILLPLYYRVRFEVTLFKLIGGSFSFVTLNILFFRYMVRTNKCSDFMGLKKQLCKRE